MDDIIKDLSGRADDATIVVLKKLIDKKLKFDKLKQNHLILLFLTTIIALCFIILIYINVIKPSSQSFSTMFTLFLSKSLHFYLLTFLVGSYGAMIILQNKRDEAEVEFHDLRCEVIAKSPDFWQNESWLERNYVFKLMKEQFDINLYYESK